MKSAFTSSDLTGAVGESSRNGSTSTVLPAVSMDQALWPYQVICVDMVVVPSDSVTRFGAVANADCIPSRFSAPRAERSRPLRNAAFLRRWRVPNCRCQSPIRQPASARLAAWIFKI